MANYWPQLVALVVLAAPAALLSLPTAGPNPAAVGYFGAVVVAAAAYAAWHGGRHLVARAP